MTQVKTETLKTLLSLAGLHDAQVTDIIGLLADKPEKVQLAFYYRTAGLTQQEIADKIDYTQQQVSYILSENLDDIRKYLKKF